MGGFVAFGETLASFKQGILSQGTLDDDGILFDREKLSPVQLWVVDGEHIGVIEYSDTQIHAVVGKVLVLEAESHVIGDESVNVGWLGGFQDGRGEIAEHTLPIYLQLALAQEWDSIGIQFA